MWTVYACLLRPSMASFLWIKTMNKTTQRMPKILLRDLNKEISDVASMLGQMGGEATLAKHGSEHFVKLGKKSFKKRGKKAYQDMAKKRWSGDKLV